MGRRSKYRILMGLESDEERQQFVSWLKGQYGFRLADFFNLSIENRNKLSCKFLKRDVIHAKDN